MRGLGCCMAFFSKGLTYFLAFIRVWRLGVSLNTPPLSAQRLCWQGYACVSGVYLGVCFCKARWGLERSSQLSKVPALCSLLRVELSVWLSSSQYWRSGHIQHPFLVPTDVTRDLGSETPTSVSLCSKESRNQINKGKKLHAQFGPGWCESEVLPTFSAFVLQITESSETRLEHRWI